MSSGIRSCRLGRLRRGQFEIPPMSPNNSHSSCQPLLKRVLTRLLEYTEYTHTLSATLVKEKNRFDYSHIPTQQKTAPSFKSTVEISDD